MCVLVQRVSEELVLCLLPFLLYPTASFFP